MRLATCIIIILFSKDALLGRWYSPGGDNEGSERPGPEREDPLRRGEQCDGVAVPENH